MKFLKLMRFLLFKIHLWLPLMYSLVFLIITVTSGLLTVSWPFYFLGLSLSMIGTLGLVYYTRKKSKDDVEENFKPASKRDKNRRIEGFMPVSEQPPERPAEPVQRAKTPDVEETVQRIREEQNYYGQVMSAQPNALNQYTAQVRPIQLQPGYQPAQPYVQPMPTFQQQPYITQYGQPYVQPTPPVQPPIEPPTMAQYYAEQQVTAQNTDMNKKLYGPFTQPQSPSAPQSNNGEQAESNFTPYIQPINAKDRTSASPDMQSYEATRRNTRQEEPTIYRTRKDPNILIYEYSDCIEKYAIGRDGSRTLIGTEFKRV